MILHGNMYSLLKKINALSGEDVLTVPAEGKLQIMRDKIKENLAKAHERYTRQYNTRARVRRFTVGQEVYRRNFTLSSAGDKICKKFARKFIKCRVRAVKGTNLYELEDQQGKAIGTFHAKDIFMS